MEAPSPEAQSIKLAAGVKTPNPNLNPTTMNRPCSCGKPRDKHWHLACPDCWALIPTALQDEVWDEVKVRPGSPEHRSAVRRCYEAIRRGRAPRIPEIPTTGTVVRLEGGGGMMINRKP